MDISVAQLGFTMSKTFPFELRATLLLKIRVLCEVEWTSSGLHTQLHLSSHRVPYLGPKCFNLVEDTVQTFRKL